MRKTKQSLDVLPQRFPLSPQHAPCLRLGLFFFLLPGWTDGLNSHWQDSPRGFSGNLPSLCSKFLRIARQYSSLQEFSHGIYPAVGKASKPKFSQDCDRKRKNPQVGTTCQFLPVWLSVCRWGLPVGKLREELCAGTAEPNHLSSRPWGSGWDQEVSIPNLE